MPPVGCALAGQLAAVAARDQPWLVPPARRDQPWLVPPARARRVACKLQRRSLQSQFSWTALHPPAAGELTLHFH
eukprot:6472670-Prymnesium_polylepis.1